MKAQAIGARQSAWLLGAATASCAPLVLHLPAGLAVAVGAMLAWQAAILAKALVSPRPWLISALALAAASAIVVYYRTLFGRDPGVALLVVLLAMKLLEMRSRRDAYAAILLCLFLLESQFLYAQTMASAAVGLFVVILVCLTLLIVHQPQLALAAAGRRSAQLLAQALPFMLALFLLFPRVSGPLWGLPLDAHAGLTGLSESMAPGSISALSQSDAIAFRVQFEGGEPPHRALYWRGPVLTRFDGETWTGKRSLAPRALTYANAGTAVNYILTLEAHGKSWLFALELPGLVPEGAYSSADYQLLTRSPVRARQRYEMRSFPDAIAGKLESAQQLRDALELPSGFNPRARALAASWRDQLGADDAALVGRVLAYYRDQAFTYTLTPPLLGHHAMDEFLFDTRRGFCEHYAASFVFMMRAAGIPARVVTGYQGGEHNPVDDTLVVRQSDAHAWAEVWTKDWGWRRVDPTAMIAPSRIETDLATALPVGEPLPLIGRVLWLRELRYRWDALSNAWNQRVLGYDPRRQRELLARLGMQAPDWQRMIWALSLLCGLLLAALAAWALLNWQRVDAAAAAWRRLSAKLASAGLPRRPWEGPLAYAGRVGAALPGHGPELAEIAGLYASLRYGRSAAPGRVGELKQRVRRFRP